MGSNLRPNFVDQLSIFAGPVAFWRNRGGGENAGHENAKFENDGPNCVA